MAHGPEKAEGARSVGDGKTCEKKSQGHGPRSALSQGSPAGNSNLHVKVAQVLPSGAATASCHKVTAPALSSSITAA